jgi:hypothetical protein
MDRWLLLVAVALALFWRSDCLTIENGVIVNRCGLWQKFTGQPMTIVMGPQGPVAERVIYRDRVVKEYVVVPQHGPPPVIGLELPPQRNIITAVTSAMFYGVSGMSIGFDENYHRRRYRD